MTGLELVDLRIRRAEQHIDTMGRILNNFTKGAPYDVSAEPNSDRSEYVLRLKVSQHPPPALSAAFSDVIHNLRSCLDNMVYVLAGSPKAKWAKNLEFPIINTGPKGGRPRFDRTAKNKLRRVHPDAIAIIEGIQPYHGFRGQGRPPIVPWPPFPLTVLRDLSNFDKHRAPHIVFHVPVAVRLMSSVLPARSEVVPASQPLEDGAVIARYWFDEPNVNVNDISIDLDLAAIVPGKRPVMVPLESYVSAMFRIIELYIFNPLKPYIK